MQEARSSGEWNARVRALGGSFPQSWEWGEFRRRLGWRPLRLYDPEAGAAAQVLLRELPAGLGYFGYVPYGPVAATAGGVCKAASLVGEAARERGVVLLKVEPRIPESDIPGLEGFFRSPETVQPRITMLVDILEDPEEQLRRLPKDTRYGIRRSKREGVELAVSTGPGEELEDFLQLLEQTSDRQRFAIRPRSYYRDFMRDLPAYLILARHEGRAVAGAIIVIFGEEAYYLFGASIPDRQNLYAPYLVQWENMNVARRAGAVRYDMWGGVPGDPEDRSHPLWGVYQFKKKFGGRIEKFAGAYDRDLARLRGRLARTGLRGYAALRRLRARNALPPAD
ncbi:peptidoglycan bridge formation glycyltransferase FemA/FemB family protein [Rubrobacter taiwanensis]|uniref:Peptidoglycan bridge formation glycyltransferase FemA/FemB family protein n=1 Tax=Rubrobacter taiwanensis TaxID=185139 RepID=A0A4R1BDH5_9ACTN|nr:peptidoglycan bridge formation glycyltransferase FemA/FemB family protein [Rubrobacter taiwanensis]TCJ15131.1 peptidoglycan bridge formation glycyltransferase FemA/FemB family protein [Rubrobacter taiwanensis]